MLIQSDSNGSTSTTFDGRVSVDMGDGNNTVEIGVNQSVQFDAAAVFTANASGYNHKVVDTTTGTTPTFNYFD